MSPAGIIITGGYDASDTRLRSTEVLTGEGWLAGPDMPVAVASHCQVSVGSRVYVSGRAGVLSIISINIINIYRWLHW